MNSCSHLRFRFSFEPRPTCFVSVLLVALCGVSATAQDSSVAKRNAKSGKMNVLLMIADDLSANALGCYGNQQCQSPHIDRLAKDGIQFLNAYCQFPVCGPSRAAMMSGMYCQSNGVLGNGMSARFTANMQGKPSMSQWHIQHGWFSARVSKIYHMRVPGDITAGVDGPDHLASWNERFNCKGPEWMSEGKHEHLTKEKLKRIPDRHYNLGFGGAFYTVKTRSPNGKFQPDKIAADKAIEFLNRKRDRPFFLAVGFVRPHVPLVAPGSYFDRYDPQAMKLPTVELDDWADIPPAGISKNSKRIGLDSKAKKQKVLQAYYASVTFMDDQVGRVLDELRRLGLDKNTIVIFKSDHGYHLGEHEFWQKMSLHEESARIPLLISVPGLGHAQQDATERKTGTKVSALVEAIDLYPTLAELNGLKIPKHCQGKSLVSLITGQSRSVRDAAFCTTGKADLVRTSEYAYIRYRKDQSEELYDMKSDPRQITNLAKSAKHQAPLKNLRSVLQEHLAHVTPRPQ